MKIVFTKTLNSFKQTFPVTVGVLLLVSMAIVIIPKIFYSAVFSGNKLTDPLLGALLGSISEGNPCLSANKKTAQSALCSKSDGSISATLLTPQ